MFFTLRESRRTPDPLLSRVRSRTITASPLTPRLWSSPTFATLGWIRCWASKNKGEIKLLIVFLYALSEPVSPGSDKLIHLSVSSVTLWWIIPVFEDVTLPASSLARNVLFYIIGLQSMLYIGWSFRIVPYIVWAKNKNKFIGGLLWFQLWLTCLNSNTGIPSFAKKERIGFSPGSVSVYHFA